MSRATVGVSSIVVVAVDRPGVGRPLEVDVVAGHVVAAVAQLGEVGVADAGGTGHAGRRRRHGRGGRRLERRCRGRRRLEGDVAGPARHQARSERGEDQEPAGSGGQRCGGHVRILPRRPSLPGSRYTCPVPTVLVTGATGYIGGRLVPELLDAGHEVRCLARTPAKLRGRRLGRPGRGRARATSTDADALARGAGRRRRRLLPRALDGRVRRLRRGRPARRRGVRRGRRRHGDRASASSTSAASASDDDPSLSRHLPSRHEVGGVLGVGPVPVTELRAAVIIGSGSASFEMLRYLVEVLPVMVTPRWVDNRCQPIAIRDVLARPGRRARPARHRSAGSSRSAGPTCSPTGR